MKYFYHTFSGKVKKFLKKVEVEVEEGTPCGRIKVSKVSEVSGMCKVIDNGH
jgi:hypothetical protein